MALVGLGFILMCVLAPPVGHGGEKGPGLLTGARTIPGPARGLVPRIYRPWHDPVAGLALTTLEKPHPLAGSVTLAAFACHYGFRISLMH